MKIRQDMQIYFVTESPIPHAGGMSTHLLLLKDQLSSLGYGVELTEGTRINIASHKVSSALKSIFTVRNLHSGWALDRMVRLRNDIQKKSQNKKVDVFHCHDPISACAVPDDSVPLVLTVHGPMVEHALEHGCKDQTYLRCLADLEQKAFKRANHIIAVDTGQKDILLRKGVPSHKISIIFNAVNSQELCELGKQDPPIQEDSDYFIMTRRLVPKNGPLIGVQSFLSWVGSRNVKLLVAGDGPLRDSLVKTLRNHPQGHKVRMLGRMNNKELIPLIKRSIGSLVPSVPVKGVIEATSLSALESLALDVPLIASDIGGLSEIDHGYNVCFLFEAGNIGQLEERLETVYGMHVKGTSWRTRAHIDEFFGVENWMQSHINIYRSELERVKRQPFRSAR